MKQLFIAIFLVVSLSSFAQKEFAPIGAEWYYSKLEGTTPPNEGYIAYNAHRDTLIGTQQARVISRVYHHSNGIDNSVWEELFVYEKDSCAYLFRNQQSYFLYDFSAKPGDLWTVHGVFPEWNICNYDLTGTVVVDSIGIQTINGQNLKAIYTSPYMNSVWSYPGVILEQIGCTSHLLPQPKFCMFDVPYVEGELRCFYSIGLGKAKFNYTKLLDASCMALYHYSSIQSAEEAINQINPVIRNGKLSFNWENISNLTGNEVVHIYSIQGQRLGRFRINEKVDLSNFKHGAYILSITINGKNVNSRFIIK